MSQHSLRVPVCRRLHSALTDAANVGTTGCFTALTIAGFEQRRSRAQMASGDPSSSTPSETGNRSRATIAASTERQPPFSWRPYWEEQERQWKQYDIASLACKMMLFFGNLITKAYKQEHGDVIIRVRILATIGLMGQIATLWLLLSMQQTYLRFRRVICLAHCAVICLMVYDSLPLLVTTRTPQTSLFARLLSFLFRLGSLLPITMTAMHRIPWRHIVLCCAMFSTFTAVNWPHTFCTELLSNAANRKGNLDMLTGLASALDYLTGQGQLSMLQQQPQQLEQQQTVSLPAYSTVWQSTAHSIAAACIVSNSTAWGTDLLAYTANSTHTVVGVNASSTAAVAADMDCDGLLHGQCVAVSQTLLIWFGVLTIASVVIASERYSKWRWLQRQASGSQQVCSNVPGFYSTKSSRSFIKAQLLQLHVLLDVPLLLLWVVFCHWSRPSGRV